MGCGGYSLCPTRLGRSGVAHPEVSVLHVLVETVAEGAGLSGTVSPWCLPSHGLHRHLSTLRVPLASKCSIGPGISSLR